MSPRKMRLVVDNIRGMEVEKALAILTFTKREAGQWLEKLLTSAIANWSYKTEEEPDSYELYVKTIHSDPGPSLKRFRPAPQGRAHRIRKRTNHVTLIIENRKPLASEVVAVQEAPEVAATAAAE